MVRLDAEQQAQDPLERYIAWQADKPDAVVLRSLSADDKETELTTTGFLQRVSGIAAHLQEILPAEKRDGGLDRRRERGLDATVIGLYMDLEPDLLTAYFATWCHTCTPTVLNLKWSHDVLDKVLTRLDCRVVLYNRKKPPHLPEGVQGVDLSKVADSDSFQHLGDCKMPTVALINQSSGSTGVPKSIPAPMEVYKRYCPGSAKALPNGTLTAYVAAPSFSNTTAGFMVAGYCRNTILYPRPSEGPEGATAAEVAHNVLSHLERGATQCSFTASIFNLAAASFPQDKTWKQVRNIYFGGEVTPVATVKTARKVFPQASITIGYGSTEALRAGFSLTVAEGQSVDDLTEIEYVPNSVVDRLVLLDDADNEVELKPGARGKICVVTQGSATPYVLDGDQNGDAAIKQAIDDTFRTTSKGERLISFGDEGEYREGGKVRVFGRSGRRVKVNGVFCDLGQLDDVLSAGLAGVKDVTTSLVGTAVALVFVPASNDKGGKFAEDKVREDANRLLERNQIRVAISHAVHLDNVPIAVSGKKDLKVLQLVAEQGVKRHLDSLTSVPEEDEVAQYVSSRAAELLRQPQLAGREFLFVEAGLDSISAMHLLNGLQKKYGVSLQPADLIDSAASPNAISKAVLAAKEASDGGSADAGKRSETVRARLEHDIQHYDDELKKHLGDDGGKDLVRNESARRLTIFLTGASGFAGAFILQALLANDRWKPGCTVIVHVRAGSRAAAQRRVVEQLQRCRLWRDEYEARIQAVAGDLQLPQLGLDDADWREVCHKADVVIHNGAAVHWLKPYDSLKKANVESTVECLKLATTTRLKRVVFVSGGSQTLLDVADRQHAGVATDDADAELNERSENAFASVNGYSLTKFVAERLCLKAYARGVPAFVVRPGFILGSSSTGVSNTDDFVWRLVKGCVELGKVHDCPTGLNAIAVDDFANLIVGLAAGARITSTDADLDRLTKVASSTEKAAGSKINHDEDRGAARLRIWEDCHFEGDVFEALRESGYDLDSVGARDWVAALKASLDSHDASSSSSDEQSKDKNAELQRVPQAHGEEVAQYNKDREDRDAPDFTKSVLSSATAKLIDPLGERKRLNGNVTPTQTAGSSGAISRQGVSADAGHPLAPVAHTLLSLPDDKSGDGKIGIARFTLARPADMHDSLSGETASNPGKFSPADAGQQEMSGAAFTKTLFNKASSRSTILPKDSDVNAPIPAVDVADKQTDAQSPQAAASGGAGNASSALKQTVKHCIAYLVEIGYLPQPQRPGLLAEPLSHQAELDDERYRKEADQAFKQAEAFGDARRGGDEMRMRNQVDDDGASTPLEGGDGTAAGIRITRAGE